MNWIIATSSLLPNLNKSEAKNKELEVHILELVKAFQAQVQNDLTIQMTKFQTTQSTQIAQITQIQVAHLA